MVILTREALAAREAAALAPYAVASIRSQGRTFPETESAHRTAFQRDRDRILHSAAFRRLEYKTQVFVNDEGDYYRTRLTHTLEVAQIGRTIARALAANEDLVEAICLAHDLGHPPFGHAGEDALNKMMQGVGGFNHNMQTYRVVTLLEQRYYGFSGLNLTLDTLHGIARHETSVDVGELVGFDPALGPSLEAQIADFADELAYSAHDLDDGINAGLITVPMLKDLPVWRDVVAAIDWNESAHVTETDRHVLIRELVGMFVTDVTQETDRRITALSPANAEAVQRAPRVVSYTEAMKLRARELKDFLFEHMYRSYRVLRMQRRAERFVEQIFTVFQDDPRQLPADYTARIGADSVERVIADYIACMTDRSALLEYRRLFDPLMKP
ncbi:MAG: deoxyguanosinetriphosphate triphosphohydrolase [Pleurocapsa minor GSE-CHR-MK-17-07R]|nr:deoxyguanosinetriphosphate triphosphohydrolase [Pleurocapsa minor GSE-CHR-MK 17-07R]